jgi:hypothetical protein
VLRSISEIIKGPAVSAYRRTRGAAGWLRHDLLAGASERRAEQIIVQRRSSTTGIIRWSTRCLRPPAISVADREHQGSAEGSEDHLFISEAGGRPPASVVVQFTRFVRNDAIGGVVVAGNPAHSRPLRHSIWIVGRGHMIGATVIPRRARAVAYGISQDIKAASWPALRRRQCDKGTPCLPGIAPRHRASRARHRCG